MISYQEALQRILSTANASSQTIAVALENCVNRVLREDIVADRDYPPFNRSAMDGYAVRVRELVDNNQLKLHSTILAGEFATGSLEDRECYKIMTGAPVPKDANTVIRVEDTSIINGVVTFHAVPKEGQNIAQLGEDLKKSQVVLNKGCRITVQDVCTLASLGYGSVNVAATPSVQLLATGNELKTAGEAILPHQIRNSNSPVLQALLRSKSINQIEDHIVRDDKQALRDAIAAGLTSDVLILTGGVSMGEADYVPEILKSLGVHEVLHKTAIKPGKPIWFGKHAKGVVFGLPGNPLSCMTCFSIFVDPWLKKLTQESSPYWVSFPLKGVRKKKSTLDEFFPCKLIHKENKQFLQPVAHNGSGDIKATVGSDGLGWHPAEHKVLNEDHPVVFIPW